MKKLVSLLILVANSALAGVVPWQDMSQYGTVTSDAYTNYMQRNIQKATNTTLQDNINALYNNTWTTNFSFNVWNVKSLVGAAAVQLDARSGIPQIQFRDAAGNVGVIQWQTNQFWYTTGASGDIASVCGAIATGFPVYVEVDPVYGTWLTGTYASAESTTNRVAKTGDTISGAILSTASSALTAPANDELPTAGWVRGLFDSGDFWYFVETTSSVNAAYGNFARETQAVLFSKSVASVTNTQYAISGMTTQRFTRVQGPMFCNAWIRQIDNGAGNSLSCHPEFYYTYDGTNLFGDYEAPAKTISTANTTNFYDWIVPFPSVVSTSAAGFYVVARMKIDVANNAGIEIVGGGTKLSTIGFTVPALNSDPNKLSLTGGTVTGNLFNVNTTFAGVTNGSYWTYYGTTQAVFTVYVGTNLWNLTFTP